ncbi:MAG: SRPBCC domain-containing protein [Oligoflexales bacterium]|nr:SRPBCC domain-containing protein [Oligoflexales bacterium]
MHKLIKKPEQSFHSFGGNLQLLIQQIINVLKMIGIIIALGFVAACQHTTEAVIDIEATPAEVWAVLSDASSFQQWNPVHVRIEGEFKKGSQVTVHLKEPSGEINVFDSTVRAVDDQKLLSQGGGTPGLFTFSHSFSLKPKNGGTQVTQREEFKGLGVIFIDMAWTQKAYESVNLALKAQVEKKTK